MNCDVSKVFLMFHQVHRNDYISLLCFTQVIFFFQETNLIYVVFPPGPGGSPVLAPKSTAAPSDKGSVPLKVNLLQFRKNVSDLRMQLHQMRQLQARPLCPLN